MDCTLETLEARLQLLKDKELDLRTRGLFQQADALRKSYAAFEKELSSLQADRLAFEKEAFAASQKSNNLADKIGTTSLSDDQFNLLNPQQQYDHMLGLSRGPIDASSQGRRKAIAQSMKQWFSSYPDAETISPFSAEAGRSYRQKQNVERAYQAAERRMIEEGFTVVARGNGPTLEWELRDGVTGDRVIIDNKWHGIHLADELYRQNRLKGDSLTPFSMKDFKSLKFIPREPEFDPMSGEPNMLKEANISASTLPENARIAFGTLKTMWFKHVGAGKRFFNALSNAYEETTGRPWPLKGLWLDIADAGNKMEARASSDLLKLQSIASRFGVPWKTDAQVRVMAFAKQRDWEVQRIRNMTAKEFEAEVSSGIMDEKAFKKIANERVQQSFSKITKDAQAAHNLTDNEVAFADAVFNEHVKPLLLEAGIPADDIQLGWIWRIHDLQYADNPPANWLHRDSSLMRDNSIERLFAQDAEVRAKQGLDDQKLFLDPVLDPLAKSKYSGLQEIAKAGNFADLNYMLARNIYRRMYMGRIANQYAGQISIEGQQFLLSGVPISSELGRRYIRELEAIEGIPTAGEAASNTGRRERLVQRSLKLAELADSLDDHGAPSFVTNALSNYYTKLGMKSAQSYVPSLFDTWVKLYRGQSFGLNLPKAVRDVVTNDFLMGVRLPAGPFWQAWKETRLPNSSLLKEYIRQKNLNWLPDLMQNASQVELTQYFEEKPHMKPILEALASGKMPPNLTSIMRPSYWADLTQFFYKVGDIGSRMQVNRASELAATRAWERFKSTPASSPEAQAYRLDRFLIDTGVVFSDADSVARVKDALSQAQRTGSTADIINVVRNINTLETVGLFRRWNSSPFMDSAPGKLAGQFFSWNRNLMESMISTVTGPARNLSSTRAKTEAYSSITAKWAIGAEALYALGGALNVDTSTWIPFVHHWAPPNGPFLTTVQNARALIGGNDPMLRRRIESSPAAAGAVAMMMMRQAIPFLTGPAVLQRTVGQFYGPQTIPDWARHFLQIAPQQQDSYNQFLVSIGADPLNSPLYPKFRVGGLSAILFGNTAGRLQDELSKAFGGALPPGTFAGVQNWTPPIGAKSGVNQ